MDRRLRTGRHMHFQDGSLPDRRIFEGPEDAVPLFRCNRHGARLGNSRIPRLIGRCRWRQRHTGAARSPFPGGKERMPSELYNGRGEYRMNDPSFARRDFLRTTALAASAVAFSPDAGAFAAEPAPWAERPMRWAQLTLAENDPGQYDPHFWLDYFERTHCDAACLSAGGCVAYYPTKIPAPLSQPVDEGQRPVRRTRGRLPQAEHGRAGAHRSARRPPGRLRCAPRLDRRRRRRQEAAAIGPCLDGGSPARSAPTTSSS